jgi:1-deoxy-D-xylulose-5-phosphate reductoisomerase
VDSEHSAIFQCLRTGRAEEVERIILTASGGAFRDRPLPDLATVTPAEALRHPTWSMGPRITVDSATMMNKALEIGEAVALFGVPPDRIRVVQHAQSIVHSMVEFRDGSVVAQMSRPDMRLPILFALAYPERPLYEPVRFDVRDFAKLTFADPDPARFPALSLGYRAARAGGTAGAAMNAADEVAVGEFLAGRIAFPEITRRVAIALDRELARPQEAAPTLDEILDADRRARLPEVTPC